MNTEKFIDNLDNLLEELDEKQAKKVSGGITNPAGKEFDELPGKGDTKGKGKGNWDLDEPTPPPVVL